jgi:hypothetical protein
MARFLSSFVANGDNWSMGLYQNICGEVVASGNWQPQVACSNGKINKYSDTNIP